jgi:DNA-binding protein H-NS
VCVRSQRPTIRIAGNIMATYKELRLQADDLSRQADDAKARARAETIVQVVESIAEFNITADELGYAESKVRDLTKDDHNRVVAKFTRAAKYIDPSTGVTWTGAGRQPKWIVGDRETYLVGRDK